MILAAQVGELAGETAGVSVRGVSHLQAKLPNQDAVGTRREGEWALMAAADGHGAKRHYRSDRGARFAVEAVLGLVGGLCRAGREAVAAAVPHLAADLVAAWRRRVEEDIRASPIRERPGFESHAVYGTTCLAAAIGPGTALFVQIGDGDVLASVAGGEVGWVIPRDPALVGPGTYSLCQTDAAARLHVRLFRPPHPLSAPDFALLATDGLANSYREETEFGAAIAHMRDSLRTTGVTAFARDLEPWLSRCSELGSRDDVSVAIFSASRRAGPDGPGRGGAQHS